ncbi:hypothetical protein GGI15_002297 [Coemansia interrupta]|uniref:Topoisomerase 6 subunit A/Spo11 TOPRIM domain-containing protein n=1 Tax=Coemansia interrupta TaxID=1126814 RepID=A0A9W8HG74_9FUNG|nr:hypothetical protein GGI15_002297 [Coemansia interrupta]
MSQRKDGNSLPHASYVDTNTREILYALTTNMKVYILVDYDPDGAHIYQVYAEGGWNQKTYRLTGRSLVSMCSLNTSPASTLTRRLMSTGSNDGNDDGSDLPSAAGANTGARTWSSQQPTADQVRRQEFALQLGTQMSNMGSQSMGRSVPVASGGTTKAYARLNRILAENNVRRELSLRKRYEKPKYKRQRLRRESHARRFKDEVRKKVQLIMKMKNWGL